MTHTIAGIRPGTILRSTLGMTLGTMTPGIIRGTTPGIMTAGAGTMDGVATTPGMIPGTGAVEATGAVEDIHTVLTLALATTAAWHRAIRVAVAIPGVLRAASGAPHRAATGVAPLVARA